MKVTCPNYSDVPVNVIVTQEFGGLMITATYDEACLQSEVPIINDHSWTCDTHTLHISIHHTSLQGFDHAPDGNDMFDLEGETDIERALIADGRLFCCNNQILMLPGEVEGK